MRIPRMACFGPLLVGLIVVASVLNAADAPQPTPAATRQYAAAARLQNLKSYDLAAGAWAKFLAQFKTDPRADKAHYNLAICYYLDGKLDLALDAFQTVTQRFPKLEQLEAAYLYLGATQYGIAQTGKAEMYDAAIQTFNTLLKKFSQGEYLAEALYYRGECLYAQGKKQDAARSYGELIYKHPKHKLMADTLYALGVCQEELGQHEAAGKAYDQFLKQFSQHDLATEVNMRRGDTLFHAGRYDDALKRFASAAGKAGFALADYATVRQADCLAQKKRYPEAAALYGSVLTKFPKSEQIGRAALAAGKCYYLAAKYAEARKLLSGLLGSGSPSGYEAAHWVARSWLKENQAARALEVVEKVLSKARADKSSWAAPLLMDQADAVYEIPKRSKESIKLYQSLAAKYPKDAVAPQALYMAGFAALEHGQTAEALKHADAFLAAYGKHPLVPDVTHVKAESQLLLEKLTDAETLYGQLLKRYPDHSDAGLWKVRRGLVLQLQKKHRETIDALEPLPAEIRRPELVAEARYLIGGSQLELKQHEAAAKSLEAAMAAQPKWRQADETLLKLARAYRELQSFEKARASAARLIAEFPESKLLDRARYRLGEYCYLTGDPEAAAAEYRQVIDGWPKSPMVPYALHELGCVQMDLKDNAGSEQTFSVLLEKHPQHPLVPGARFGRGMARYRLQKHAPAAEDLQAFLAGNPPAAEKSNARYLLGLSQMGLGQHEAAVATFQALLEEDPKYTSADNALYQLAWAMELSGKTAEAAKTFQQLATEYADSPRTAEAYYHVGEFMYENKDYKRAAVAYYKAMEKAGKSDLGEKAAHKLAWSYYHQDELDSAQKTFDYQRTTYPEGTLAPDAAFMEAECLFRQDKFQEALEAFVEVKKLSNKDFQALLLLHAGQAAGQLKQWEKSLGFLDQCTGQFPESPHAPQAYYERGWAHQNLGALDQARKSYEKVISSTDAEVAARAQFMIGEIQFTQKDHKEAIRSYFEVVYGYSYPTWQAEATYEAARCFEVMRRTDQAAKLYRELIEKHPKSDKVPVAKQRLKELNP